MKRIKHLDKIAENMVYDIMLSPVGELCIFVSAQRIHRVLWESEMKSPDGKILLKKHKRDPQNSILKNTVKQLKEYFAGKRQQFELPISFQGTDFQIQAWQALCDIPYGETISYGEQAQRLGDKNKARAVGLANGMNPISIIVPCHRVIGSNGKLTGFGGGLSCKAWLLEHERRSLAKSL
jgi:methylated-DNA-[protein]-cysteine S-methyltransferase